VTEGADGASPSVTFL
jgi:DNA mismatch repair ATPase MutS